MLEENKLHADTMVVIIKFLQHGRQDLKCNPKMVYILLFQDIPIFF